MWRLFKHYNVSASYDGIAESVADASKVDLDKVEVAGQLRLAALYEIVTKRQWRFAYQLKALTDLQTFQEMMNGIVESSDHMTPKKWKRHLLALKGFKIIKSKAKSAIKAFARYFAVMKSDGLTAPAIFNGKKLSKAFLSPPTTNLPDIADVLQEIAKASYLIIGDWRHYFHQFGLADSVSEYFGLEIGNETFVYAVLPMGWSWSPRLAQSASMAILLEAATRAKLIDPADYANLDNPPSMIRMRGGCATVWYDNVIGMFEDANCRDQFYSKLEDLCSEKQMNVAWKNLKKYNRNDMAESNEEKANQASTPEEKERLELPSYLGLMIANACGRRERDEDGTAKMKWKHHPDRLARWKPLAETKSYATLRDIARAVGCILWDAVIGFRPLCDEAKVLEILSTAGKAVANNNWNASLSPHISSDDVEYLRMRLDGITPNNEYHTENTKPASSTIRCASDACDDGFGYVVWNLCEKDCQNLSIYRE